MFITEVARTLKWTMAVGRYTVPCLQMGEVMLTQFEMGCKVCVTAMLPIVLFMLVKRESL